MAGVQLGTEEKAHEQGRLARCWSLQGRSKPWKPVQARQPESVEHLKESCLCWESEVVPKRVCAPRLTGREKRMKQWTPWLRDVHFCWPLEVVEWRVRPSRKGREALVPQ